MSDWARHIDELAGATAALLVNGPAAPALRDVKGALAARDAVVVELGALVAAVSDVPRLAPVRELTVFDLVHRPGQALAQAIAELPRALPFGTLPSLPRPGRCGVYEGEWQRAARATLALEGYMDALGRLPGQHAWNVLRDLADLAAALPYLDHDLAEVLLRHTDSTSANEPYESLTHAGHDALRLAAGELRVRIPSVDAHAEGAPISVGGGIGGGEPDPVGHAMSRLIHSVSSRGANLSVADLRAVSRLLETGSRDAAEVLHGQSDRWPDHDRVLAALQAVSGAARLLRDAPVKSMTAAHLDLLWTSADLRALLETRAAETRACPPRSAVAGPGGPRRTALEFARHLPDLAHALEGSVRQALSSGLMLVPGVPQQVSANSITWVTTKMSASQDEPPAVLARVLDVGDATRGLNAAILPVTDLLGRSAKQIPSTAEQALAAARRYAGAARAELREALAERSNLQPSLLTATIPGHPRQAPSRQPAGRRC